MLFLFNDVVFDLGDLTGVLQSGMIPLSPAQIEQLTAAQLNTLARETVFRDPDVARHKPEHIKHLVALILYRAPGANALLAVRPAGAKDPSQVGLRYAQVPLTTLAYLWGEQSAGRLNAQTANTAVWSASNAQDSGTAPLPRKSGTR